MIPTNNETYELKCYKRVENSPYLYDEFPSFTFKGRVANNIEVKTYRIQKGVNGNNDSVFVYASNLPKGINIQDKVYFLGKEWIVQSIGYYFEMNRIANANAFNEEQIINRCPKGMNLQ